jgi:hypothetical protein
VAVVVAILIFVFQRLLGIVAPQELRSALGESAQQIVKELLQAGANSPTLHQPVAVTSGK